MFAEKHYPEILLPEELDAYLEKGWYRMGQTIFTTHFLCFGEQFYSAIWVRLPLEGYSFRKSLRKLYRKNNKQFQTITRPAFLSPEKEKLFRKYKRSFTGMLAPSLRDSLMDGEDFNIFTTYEVSVYKENKLVAVSFFDRGNNSVASIMGIYDPEYQKYSLGIFTMLVEITFCQENHIPYYYPGYVVPGYPRFDYKLRIGEVEYFDLPTQSWFPYKELTSEDIPLYKMEDRLSELKKHLKQDRIRAPKLYYPLFEANLFGFWRAPYFDFPVLLWCNPRQEKTKFLITVYDVREEAYLLLSCAPFDDLQFYFNESFTNTFDRERFFMELIVTEKTLARGETPEEIAAAITKLYKKASTDR